MLFWLNETNFRQARLEARNALHPFEFGYFSTFPSLHLPCSKLCATTPKSQPLAFATSALRQLIPGSSVTTNATRAAQRSLSGETLAGRPPRRGQELLGHGNRG